jgi:large subunit ribosomal protein L1
MTIYKNIKKMNELNSSIKLETNSLTEVVSKMKNINSKVKRKFDESVDIIVNININLKKEQGLRGTCVLPHGNGKKIKIAVFAEGKEAEIAKELGVEIVGGEELINKIRSGDEKLAVNKCVATPAMMLKLTKIASILGKRGIMPNQKDGTITDNMKDIITNIKKGIVFFQSEKKSGHLQASIGRISYSENQLEENIKEFIANIKKFQKNPKISLVKSVYISTTMGLSYNININSF